MTSKVLVVPSTTSNEVIQHLREQGFEVVFSLKEVV